MEKTPNVSFHKLLGKWMAYVDFCGKRSNLGLFSDQDAALKAVKEFKEKNDIELDGDAPIKDRVVYSGGELFWKYHGRGHSKGERVGSRDKRSGYWFARDSSGAKKYLHRLVWEMHFGPIDQAGQIDHINGVRSDNRIENLRVVSSELNMKNKRVTPKNSTGHRGVSALPSGKFLARVWASGKAIRIGVFDTAEEAGAARVRAEPMHGYHENHGKI